MFSQKDVIGWLGNIAVVEDHEGGYWLVDWSDGNKRMHIEAKEKGVK